MRLRVFVSSTYYDLKHLRSSLEAFIESLGFDAVLSEKGDIAYTPDVALDESCYREVANADIFVLILGGKYGSTASKDKSSAEQEKYFGQYDSITKREYEAAEQKGIPIYVLIESAVHSEYRTYLKNKENEKMEYAHVDSPNVYRLIESILSKSRNNPVQSFERFSDIQSWLREQWSGYFRELIRTKSENQPLMALKSQIDALGEVTKTMQRYLETLMSDSSDANSVKVISEEHDRLRAQTITQIRNMPKVIEYISIHGIAFDMFLHVIETATDLNMFTEEFCALSQYAESEEIQWPTDVLQAFNTVRRLLGKPEFHREKTPTTEDMAYFLNWLYREQGGTATLAECRRFRAYQLAKKKGLFTVHHDPGGNDIATITDNGKEYFSRVESLVSKAKS